MPRRAPILAGLAVAAVLGIGGCGGDDNGDGVERAAERDIQAGAQERAESLVLRPSDFPEGWRAAPAEEEDEGSGERFRRCTGVDLSDFTVIGEADSDEFAMGESAQVSSEATVLETVRDAEEGVAEASRSFARASTEACLGRLIADTIAERSQQEVAIGEVEITELRLTPLDIQEARGWQIAIPLQVEGVSTAVVLEYVALRDASSVVSIQTQDVGRPLDAGLRDRLLRVLAGRLSE